MKAGNVMGAGLLALGLAGLALALSGCHGIPQGTVKEMPVGAVQLKAVGAGIVKADAQQTVYQIKCTVCGYQSEATTIDTPVTGKPYTIEWVCPKCGHRQKITIQALSQ